MKKKFSCFWSYFHPFLCVNAIFRSLLDIFSNRHKFYCPSTKIGRTCTGFNFASIDENDASGFQELANDLQFDDRSKISKHCYFIINKIYPAA